MDVRHTNRIVEVFNDHQRVASHRRTSQRAGHVTVNEHMPETHQHYANTPPASLIKQAAKISRNAAILVERLMRDRPHPQQDTAPQKVFCLSRAGTVLSVLKPRAIGR